MEIVIITGAGISAESGISTFRDSGGLWENFDVMQVASIQGYQENPELVNTFYNKRRKQLLTVEPNNAHKALVKLEKEVNTTIITQNVDDLHERAGSKKVIHLHGELTKMCSTKNKNLQKEIGYTETEHNEIAPDGGFWRPFIVWFGEEVPMMEKALSFVTKADILIVVGTSLQVYPAASLVYYTKSNCKIFLVEPSTVEVNNFTYTHIKEKASTGVPALVEDILSGKV